MASTHNSKQRIAVATETKSSVPSIAAAETKGQKISLHTNSTESVATRTIQQTPNSVNGPFINGNTEMKGDGHAPQEEIDNGRDY